MAGSQDNEPPAIGTTYNGSRVVDVQVEVSDRGMRTRKRSTITLENGIIMKLDHFVDKKFEQLDTSRRRAPPPRTRSSGNDALPQRGLPKSKSGRHLPKPTASHNSKLAPMRTESPARGVGRSRSSSRGRDMIVREKPKQSKASVQGTDRIPRIPQRYEPPLHQSDDLSLSPEEGKKPPVSMRELSPEPSTPKRPSSFKNISNFLTSPKRRAPGHTMSGSDLEAMRCSAHSCNNKSSMTECNEESSKKRGSLKNLGKLMPKPKIGRAKSGDDLHAMQEESKREGGRQRRRSTATSESNKEKLRSFKEMISAAGKVKNKAFTENERRRSSLQEDLPPATPRTVRRSVAPQMIESTSPKESPQREPSLSPDEVKKPSSSSYITGFLDKLYDSYIKDDGEEGSEDDSDGGYGQNSKSLLDVSIS